MADKVKVAVRVRPLNRRADSQSSLRLIIVFGHAANLMHTFREDVFRDMGSGILQNAFQGYNACIFAYGQTGSGKSYTMMGSPDNPGIVPRLCNAIFDRIQLEESPKLIFKAEVSYMEIYNEKVRDLLDPKGVRHNLKVREHNILGPYVDGLSNLAVSSVEQIAALMDEGNKARTVASTNMNSESSRSHAVFSIKLSQTLVDLESGTSGEKVSKMSLVDLAGSERAQKTGAVGERLKEGSNINKSLTTLGLVISALADQNSKKNKFVPYRDSVLTWLLKDNLGGNSRTVMVATISPAADNYEESLSTLRYADRAKRIMNHAVVNEDPNAKIIRELREEVESLRALLNQQSQTGDLNDRLLESEKLMMDMNKSWEERLKETEKIHREQQEVLKKAGVSVQERGIKVDNERCYLVNLNADPSMNELLVYYLKERTLIGRPDAPVPQDIQLQGLAIMPQHAIISMNHPSPLELQLIIEPVDDARTCVNGSMINGPTPLRHGDRLIWGNNHFFRVNCPGQNAMTPSENQKFDYKFAQEELMMHELSNDPIAEAVETIEKQHEQDKLAALERQRQMYEKHILRLKCQMSPGTNTPLTPSVDWFSRVSTPGHGVGMFPNSNVQQQFVQWAQEREENFKQGLVKLKEDIVRANGLVREANFMATEMEKKTSFHVTLQIPAWNLTPAKIKKSAFVSEPAILVKRTGIGNQVWTMEKLDNKLIDMRDLYDEWKEKSLEESIQLKLTLDPFYESQQTHNLVGVANVFLEVLFHDVKLDYLVPIINQQGEVAGRLHVEIYRVSASKPEPALEALENGVTEAVVDPVDLGYYGQLITCRVRIKKVVGLPQSLAHFVFCQYTFFGNAEEPIVVPPAFDNFGEPVTSSQDSDSGVTYVFDHSEDFNVLVNDEFLEHVQESALSIEVYGHKSAGFSSVGPTGNSWDVQNMNATKNRSLQERWSEVTRRLELMVEVHEMNDAGEYAPVELQKAPEVPCGGVYQLRQGLQKRIKVQIRPVPDTGSLPLICQQITSISLGCISARSRNLQKGLDSYQEEDLNILRERWSDALSHRKQYLDDEIQRLMQKSDKTDADAEREHALISQWIALTEERNAVLVPTPNSGVPGAPADWESQATMERHIPVLFLDLNDDMTAQGVAISADCSHPVAGLNSILPKEHSGRLFSLPIIKFDEQEMTAVVSWDSSIHECVSLNRPTPDNERVYAILKIVVRLSHPSEMELVLRKRVCFNIIRKISLTQKFMRKITGSPSLFSCGVIYEIVSNIPKATEDPEARETLALMAAQSSEQPEGSNYIEKYTKGISAVESILALDRLRQEVAIKELLSEKSRKQPKKSSSLPEGFAALSMRRSMDDNALSEMTTGGSQRPMHLPHRRSIPARMTISGLDGGAKSDDSSLVSSLVSPVSQSGTRLATPRRLMNPVIEEQNKSDSNDGGPLTGAPASSTTVVADIHRTDSEMPSSSVNHATEMEGCSMSVSETNDSIVSVGDASIDGEPITPAGERHKSQAINNQGSAEDPSVVSSGYGSQAALSCRSDESLETVQTNLISQASAQITKSDHINRNEEDNHKLVDEQDENGNEAVESSKSSKPMVGDVTDPEGNQVVSPPPDAGTAGPILSALPGHMNTSRLSVSESMNSSVNSMCQSTYSEYGAELRDMNESTLSITSSGDLLGNNLTRKSRDDMASSRDTEDHRSRKSSSSDKTSELASSDSVNNNATITKSNPMNVPNWLQVGVRVVVQPGAKNGSVKYVGPAEFAHGSWIGVALDQSSGKHNGTVDGVKYFFCGESQGIFVRPEKVSQLQGSKAQPDSVRSRKPPKGSSAAALSTARRGSEKTGALSNSAKNKQQTASNSSLNSLMKPTAASSARILPKK